MPGDITGIVHRVTYQNNETHYCVLQLETSAGLVTVVGTIPAAVVGSELALTGEWQIHPVYGKQFRVSGSRQVAPVTLRGIERYLSSGLVKGVGPALAGRLVAHFGLDTLQVIAQNPERLIEVPGLGAKRREGLQLALKAHQAIQDIMVFLQGLGASPALAARIHKRYGAQAVQVLQQNPYRLAEEVWGVGFLTADRLAQSLGVSPSAPERSRAAVMYLLQEASNAGHIYLSIAELEQAGEKLGLMPELCREGVARQAEVGRLVVEDEGDAIYLPRMHQAECEVASLLLALQNAVPVRSAALPLLTATDEAAPVPVLHLNDEQKLAVAAAMQGGVLVITGGPGTGKTTIMREIVRQAKLAGKQALLAAPTGRAAKRMEEATGVAARTIHRLLEFTPGFGEAPFFKRNADNPLAADLVIVDEVSMLDLPLACHLLRAVAPGTALVLVGDADQLPSVGPGNFLRDVLQAGTIRFVRLTHVFRQAEASMIVVNAHRINSGQMPLCNQHGSDFFLIEERNTTKLAEQVRELVAKRLPTYLGCHPIYDIQTLSAVRRGPAGVHHLNQVLQAALNPQASASLPVAAGDEAGAPAKADNAPNGADLPQRLYTGDRVMQLRNNYTKMVFNGDIGQVRAIDADTGAVSVSYPDRDDGEVVVYDADELDELELAYAASVHKSQGSEYPAVVVPLVRTMPALMTRNLLYTAVTRAKRLVVLVGSSQTLRAYVDNATAHKRNSRLASRLANDRQIPLHNGAGT